VPTQRQFRKRGLLSADRLRRLEALGVEWDPYAAYWEEMFARLVRYKERFGHCKVPKDSPEDSQLGHWVDKQRQLKGRDHLTAERLRRLEDLGFACDPFSERWEEMFASLVTFKEKTGSCDVPRGSPENVQLAIWAHTQRRLYTLGRLSSERVQRLTALGFEWDPLTAVWEEMFARLVRYKERIGHCNVPAKWPEDPRLRGWVGTQRNLKKHDRLSPDRLKRLETLGFLWNEIAAAWEEMFARLVQFKEHIGHCNVPQKWSEDSQLATWVGTQRQRRKGDAITADHLRRLDALGFQWDPLAAAWEEMFARLVQFKERFGDCNVPADWPEDPRLGRWVGNQRELRKHDRLSSDRLQRLGAFGFEWDARTATWEEMFARLVRYKERFGHCNVPAKWPEDQQLRRWIGNQRQFRKTKRLSRQRVRRLDNVGFDWGTIQSDLNNAA